MSRSAFVVSVIVLGVVATFSLSGCTKPQSTDAQAFNELEQKCRKWQSTRDRLKKFVGQLQTDKKATLDKLRQLGIKTENDLSGKPMAQVLNSQRIKTNTQIWLCEKKLEALDLAIVKADDKKKDISRQQLMHDSEIDSAELRQVMEAIAATERELEEVEVPTPPDTPLEQDLNSNSAPAKSEKAKVQRDSSGSKVRKWTKVDGTTFEGEFVNHVKGTGVTVRQADGKEVTVKMNTLSEEDKKYVREMDKST